MDNDHIDTIVDAVIDFVDEQIENDQSTVEEIVMENEFKSDDTEVHTVNLNDNDDLIEDIISGIIKDSVNLIENIQGTSHNKSDIDDKLNIICDSDEINYDKKEVKPEIIDFVNANEKDTKLVNEDIDGASEIDATELVYNDIKENLENTDHNSNNDINKNVVIIESDVIIDDENIGSSVFVSECCSHLGYWAVSDRFKVVMEASDNTSYTRHAEQAKVLSSADCVCSRI